MEKKTVNFFGLLNMSIGFFGIQFGWGLQMANMSAIFEHLGAEPHQIPILWLAAPLTGLLVQPIIGYMSDNTWGPLGRRRPYFLVGAIFSSMALIYMPNSSVLWMAAALLWILDTSVNISMEPFRAFVADILPKEQQTQGFAMQSLFIGLGAVMASILPWLLSNFFHVPQISTTGKAIPLTVELSFQIGGVVFLGTVLWTVLSTKEYPPEDIKAFQQQKKEQAGVVGGFTEIISALREMPQKMRQLAWVQFFTWMGMYCVFLYFPTAVARNIFAATDENSILYAAGVEWAGICIAVYNAVCFLFSFLLAPIARATSRQFTHSFCLFCGALGLFSLALIKNEYALFLPMIGLGIGWASILSMPYAMLVTCLPPERSGVYMGIFNFFIVLPQILVSLGFGWVMQNLLNGDRLSAVIFGGVFMVVAAVLTQRVEVTKEVTKTEQKMPESQLSSQEN